MTFDPYHEWLGIPAEEQPPNYYRLLGIREHEDSVSVIDNAANRQMLLVKTFQNGPRSELSQRILNEISQARTCLLNAESKAEYDGTLKLNSVLAEQPTLLSDEQFGRRGVKRPATRNFVLFRAMLMVAVAFGLLAVALLIVVDENDVDDTTATEPVVEKKPLSQPADHEASNAESGKLNLVGKSEGDLRRIGHLKIKFCWCPPGSFKMGDQKNNAPVVLSRGFWIGQTEVTQREWTAVVGTKPWLGKADAKDGPDYPASHISWFEAREFCKRLTAMEKASGRLPDDWNFVLPTEAQWEYACRAGTMTRYHFGDGVNELSEYAWFDLNADKVGQKYAHKVALKRPNDWGIFDTHGNVYEWCQDSWHPKLRGGTDPIHEEQDVHRVIRGGSWLFDAKHAESAARSHSTPGWRATRLGLRLVLIQGV